MFQYGYISHVCIHMYIYIYIHMRVIYGGYLGIIRINPKRHIITGNHYLTPSRAPVKRAQLQHCGRWCAKMQNFMFAPLITESVYWGGGGWGSRLIVILLGTIMNPEPTNCVFLFRFWYQTNTRGLQLRRKPNSKRPCLPQPGLSPACQRPAIPPSSLHPKP